MGIHPSQPSARRALQLSVLALALGLLWCVCTSTAVAAVATPNWRVIARPVPKNMPPGGEGQYEIHVENIGDVATDGQPVTVVDHLPAGMVATSAGAQEPGESGLLIPGEWGETGCEGIGTSTVTCTYDEALAEGGEPIRPYEFDGKGAHTLGQPYPIGINVAVGAGLNGSTVTNEATISGGGATSPARDAVSTTVSNSSAAFGLENIHEWFTNADGTPDVSAGSHPYEMATSVMFNIGSEAIPAPAGEVKDIHINLPAGFIGNPNATQRCTRAQFDTRLISLYPDCPSGSQVGVARLYVNAGYTEFQIPIYNLVPPAGMPAQLGFAGGSRVGLLDAGVATGGGYNLTIDLHNLPETQVAGAVIAIWGDPSDSSHNGLRFRPEVPSPVGERGEPLAFEGEDKPFLSQPGHCGGEGSQDIRANSWEDPIALSGVAPVPLFATDESEVPVSLEGCTGLSFNPAFTVKPGAATPDTPTGLNVGLSFPQEESVGGTAEADLKAAEVKLSAGVSINPAAANGLGACSLEQIGLDSPGPASCPDSSKVGTVTIASPALEPGQLLQGSVYVAQQGNLPGNGSNPFPGSLLALYLVAEGDGVLVKVPGEVELDQSTGQITATFAKDPVTTASTGTEQFLPALPLSDLQMSFFGGPQAALVTPASCGSYAGNAALTPWDGNPATNIAFGVNVDEGCATGGFAPGFSAGTVSPQAGAFSAATVTLSRRDGEQDLQGLEGTLPAGLLAKLAGVPQCGNTQANAGACPAASELGTVTVAAGAGSEPLYVQGHVYLTGPYNSGPFGEVVEVPAIAGPFNLDEGGRPVVVRGSIRINPVTAQATIVSDPFPTILQGIPLQVRTVNATVNRPGFAFNPTSCGAEAVTGALTSTQGTRVNVSTPFAAVNCASLPFKPSFTAATAGQASKASGASLVVKVASKGGPGTAGEEANIKSVKVDLPKQLPSRLTTLQKACTAAQFEANPAGCPKESDVGTATAHTPVLASPLTGPAYLVSHGNEAFPDLEIVLQGEGVKLVLDGNTQIKKGITSSTFKTVPDAPISSFELTLPTGKFSVLGTNLPQSAHYSFCGQTLNMPTAITGQNGAEIHDTTKIGVQGCKKKKAAVKKQRGKKK